MTNQVNNRALSFADNASYIVGRLTALQDVIVRKEYKSLYPTTKARLDHANEIIASIINEYKQVHGKV